MAQYSDEVWVALRSVWESTHKITWAKLIEVVGELMGCEMPALSVITRRAKQQKWTKDSKLSLEQLTAKELNQLLVDNGVNVKGIHECKTVNVKNENTENNQEVISNSKNENVKNNKNKSLKNNEKDEKCKKSDNENVKKGKNVKNESENVKDDEMGIVTIGEIPFIDGKKHTKKFHLNSAIVIRNTRNNLARLSDCITDTFEALAVVRDEIASLDLNDIGEKEAQSIKFKMAVTSQFIEQNLKQSITLANAAKTESLFWGFELEELKDKEEQQAKRTAVMNSSMERLAEAKRIMAEGKQRAIDRIDEIQQLNQQLEEDGEFSDGEQVVYEED